MKAAPAILTTEEINGHGFYCAVMRTLNACQISFLLGGRHALARYTGIVRATKDLDIFVRREQLDSIFNALANAGYHTELSFPHWLGKVCDKERFVDIIFSSGNGICSVDDDWFKHAVDDEVFNMPVKLCPVEEMIWSRAFVMERERYDGADIAHLFRACGEHINWRRLLDRFDVNWRVLLSCIILFGYIYPSDRSSIPAWVMQDLLTRLEAERAYPPSRNPVCRGTLLSRVQYRDDIERWGYEDARQLPAGPMTPQQAAEWSAAASDDPSK